MRTLSDLLSRARWIAPERVLSLDAAPIANSKTCPSLLAAWVSCMELWRSHHRRGYARLVCHYVAAAAASASAKRDPPPRVRANPSAHSALFLLAVLAQLTASRTPHRRWFPPASFLRRLASSRPRQSSSLHSQRRNLPPWPLQESVGGKHLLPGRNPLEFHICISNTRLLIG